MGPPKPFCLSPCADTGDSLSRGQTGRPTPRACPPAPPARPADGDPAGQTNQDGLFAIMQLWISFPK